MLMDFQNSLTDAFHGQLANEVVIKYRTHLNCVATLPCKTIFKNH